MTEKSLVKKDVGSQVIERVDALCEAGFTMPEDFNFVNAVKASMLVLQEITDKNKKPALQVCTQASIQTALFDMCVKGLDVSKKTAYFIVRGDKLCLHVSYFGHILQVKRLFPNWTPIVRVIREGDTFEYSIDPNTAKMKLQRHLQEIENIDKDFVGAYMYLPCSDGEPELYVMTRKQIMKAWSKSSNSSLQTHKDFDEKMIIKTVINSGCTKVINATPDRNAILDDDEDLRQSHKDETFTDFEDVNDVEEKPVEEPNANDGTSEKKEEPRPNESSEVADDEF